jgi:hypothetical protein
MLSAGPKIPYWDTILKNAVEACISTNLGYGAVDFLIDKDEGPLIVELNARPGLAIQLAHNDGIRWRLRKVQGIKYTDTDKSIRIAKDLFGGVVAAQIYNVSGKSVVGIKESIKIKFDGKTENYSARIDFLKENSSMDISVAEEIKIPDLILDIYKNNKFDSEDKARQYISEIIEKFKSSFNYLREFRAQKETEGNYKIVPVVNIEIEIAETEIDISFLIYEKSKNDLRITLGRKSLLGKFLLDPSK